MTAPQGEVNGDPAGDRLLDVVVVGGSQAGLAMAWHLAQHQVLQVVGRAAGPNRPWPPHPTERLGRVPAAR